MAPLERVSPWPFTGLGILACTFFLNGASLIYMHWWLVIVLYLLWVPVTIKASEAFSRRPKAVVPIAAVTVVTYLIAVGVQGLTR